MRRGTISNRAKWRFGKTKTPTPKYALDNAVVVIDVMTSQKKELTAKS
jgi:hypothetical protein